LAPEMPKEPGGGAGMAEDAEEISGRPVFSVGARVRVLAATAPGILPRLATGCSEAIVTAFDPRTREYMVKALALYSPPRWPRLPPRRPPPRKVPPPWKLSPPRKLPPPWNLPPPRGGAAKAAADAPGAEAALSPELPKEPGGGADGMAEDAEEIPGRPEEFKTRGGSLSSEGANAAAQAERSAPIKLSRSLQHNYALISNAITTLNLSPEFIFMVLYPHSTIYKSSPVDRDLSRSPNLSF
jgi:hypothetical protein